VHRAALVAAMSRLEEVPEVQMLPAARGGLRNNRKERETMAETMAAGRTERVGWVASAALDPEGPDSEVVAEADSLVAPEKMAQVAAERAVPS